MRNYRGLVQKRLKCRAQASLCASYSFEILTRTEFFIRAFAAFSLSLLILLSLTSCTNDSRTSFRRKGTSLVEACDPAVDDCPDEADGPIIDPAQLNHGIFEISLVTFDDPTGSIDIVGNGTGEIGRVCGDGSGLSGLTENNCFCLLHYGDDKQPGHANAIYFENDIIRCPVNKAFGNKVQVQIQNIRTNEVSLVKQLDLSIPVQQDLTNPDLFQKIQRYQCKPHVTIPNQFCKDAADSIQGKKKCMYDPFQSENINLTFPYNFYTDSVGFAMARRQGTYTSRKKQDNYWDCSFDLSENGPFWINPTIYSRKIYDRTSASLDEGYIIYPHQRDFLSKDRTTFHLARQAAGAMNIPVYSRIAPTKKRDDGAAGISRLDTEFIGFAASPTRTTSGWACQYSNANLPRGFEWSLVFRLGTNRIVERNFNRVRTDTLTGINGIFNRDVACLTEIVQIKTKPQGNLFCNLGGLFSILCPDVLIPLPGACGNGTTPNTKLLREVATSPLAGNNDPEGIAHRFGFVDFESSQINYLESAGFCMVPKPDQSLDPLEERWADYLFAAYSGPNSADYLADKAYIQRKSFDKDEFQVSNYTEQNTLPLQDFVYVAFSDKVSNEELQTGSNTNFYTMKHHNICKPHFPEEGLGPSETNVNYNTTISGGLERIAIQDFSNCDVDPSAIREYFMSTNFPAEADPATAGAEALPANPFCAVRPIKNE